MYFPFFSFQTVVFMGCNKGEIELGFLNMSQVSKYIMYIITYNVKVVGKYSFVKN